ncbi:MAG TPA: sigma-70 family RNA polymerase sigma factor [Bryobacteraceae bacterium]|nr:sigma-70 family RNA polymerase sigma factor [Bryobacteraceae bacterium]
MPRHAQSKKDHELVTRLKSRDPQAAGVLFDRYGKLLYSVIIRAVGTPATAEDLVHETFLRVWNRIHTFDEAHGNLEAWLITVARNRAFDYRWSLSGSEMSGASTDSLDQPGWFASARETSDRQARQAAVREALEALNREQREVVELTHLQGMTQTEIAEKLQRPLDTIKGLVRSALRNLRAATMTYKTQ